MNPLLSSREEECESGEGNTMYYTEHYAVSSHDVDVNNNIRPSMVLRFMQETANHQMRDNKPSYYDLFFSGKSFIITRISIELYEQLHQYDEIEVRCWVCEGKAATFVRCYQIYREDTLCAQAYSEWALADIHSGRLIHTSEIDFSGYEAGEKLELELPRRFHIPRDLELKKIGMDRVRYSTVDLNGHMNNTYYPDMCWDCIPDIERKMVTSINIRFVHEALLNSELDIYGAEADAGLAKDPRAEQVYVTQSRIGERKNVEIIFGLKKLEHPLWDEEQLNNLMNEDTRER
ncbi:MAG: acyl-[acyl-carrier-protein] thioesterase [Eubacterium sp.]|nr:acyl-[acyl-carrier-protein] thioesterase [Eubacterium sp.]